MRHGLSFSWTRPKTPNIFKGSKSRAITATLRSMSTRMAFAFSSSSPGASRTRAQAHPTVLTAACDTPNANIPTHRRNLPTVRQ